MATPVPATASLHPDNFASFEDFKQAAREAANQQQRQAAETYAELRASQPAQAEKWLSSFFSTKAHFQVELLDADSCQPMNISQMLDVLIDDLFARADNDFEQDEQEVKLQTLEVSQIRRSGAPAEIPGSSDQLYTDQELELVLKRLQSTKKCFRGCFAALKAKVIAARAFMLALVNLGRHMALTSTLWSLRCYSPIRKSGPSLVRKVEALRPISLCTDMAHVQDGLWMARNASNLSDYAGGEQCGGASDPQSPVLSLVIQAQLRLHQGLETFWALLDLRWAFDVASVAGMKINCWHAGVKRQDWLLIDDVLDMDTQCLQLHGCLSQLFKLRCGTAQGRKFSIHMFNGLLKWLREAVQSTLPTGLAACVPAWALYKRPGVASEMLPLCATFQAALSTLAQSTDAYNFTVGFLVTMQSDAERRLLLNSIGTHPICVAQFVDDATFPCDSVMSRVQPLVMFAAVFFAFAPGALTKLDALQWQWGKAILGCRFSKEFKRALVVAQCGWTLRLSSALMEEVAVMLARLAALPLSHPAAVMLAATEQTLASTWVSQARAMLDHSSLSCAIPALRVCFTAVELSEAQAGPAARKKLLRRYRREFVRPVLLERDRSEYIAAACKAIPGGIGAPLDWQPEPGSLPFSQLEGAAGATAWMWFRCWAIIRITGRWPCPVFGFNALPQVLSYCPACNAEDVTVFHALSSCPATLPIFTVLHQCCAIPDRSQQQQCILAVLSSNTPDDVRLSAQCYVGEACRLVLAGMCVAGRSNEGAEAEESE
ncbi:unnamed protein product [Polarella glacialis]|uniref:Uncharacterized protein n=1 Tax=Polarella glacialis TaxID=89957 RepID=A0A813JYL9_POLGL|nr:unnamed protein product [Polarella glacialis]